MPICSATLAGEMRRIAVGLDIDVPEELWPTLVEAATFRRGTSGAGGELLSDAELAHYDERVSDMAPPDLLSWLHR
jgi:aryl sulfotransferase